MPRMIIIKPKNPVKLEVNPKDAKEITKSRNILPTSRILDPLYKAINKAIIRGNNNHPPLDWVPIKAYNIRKLPVEYSQLRYCLLSFCCHKYSPIIKIAERKAAAVLGYCKEVYILPLT